MMKVDPELPLPAKESNVPTVNDYHVVAGVVHGVVDGLVFTLQHPRDLFRRLKRALPLSIVKVPVNINSTSTVSV